MITGTRFGKRIFRSCYSFSFCYFFFSFCFFFFSFCFFFFFFLLLFLFFLLLMSYWFMTGNGDSCVHVFGWCLFKSKNKKNQEILNTEMVERRIKNSSLNKVMLHFVNNLKLFVKKKKNTLGVMQ